MVFEPNSVFPQKPVCTSISAQSWIQNCGVRAKRCIYLIVVGLSQTSQKIDLWRLSDSFLNACIIPCRHKLYGTVKLKNRIPTCSLRIARSFFDLLRTSDCFKAGIIPVRLNIFRCTSKCWSLARRLDELDYLLNFEHFLPLS